MFFNRSKHSWFWYAFWTLGACFFLYNVARFFLKSALAAEKSDTKARAKIRKKKQDAWEEMFI
jgi:bacteriorhodopsin